MRFYFNTIISNFYKLLQFFYFLIRLLLTTDLRNHIPENETGAKKKIVILANGPSLKNEIDKIDFTNCEISVLNHFYKSSWFNQIKPRYYVIADPLFFEDESNYLPLIKAVEWEMLLFVPFYSYKRCSILRCLPSNLIKVIPYHTIPYKGWHLFEFFFYRKGLAMPRAQNVLVASIFTSINMGYKEIDIFGADHSWTQTLGVNETNQVCAVDMHFYEDEKKVTYAPYWKDPNKGTLYSMDEILYYFSLMFKSYHLIRKYADYRGCKITNCTKGSFIDAFERA
jgi:hypothetical protein